MKVIESYSSITLIASRIIQMAVFMLYIPAAFVCASIGLGVMISLCWGLGVQGVALAFLSTALFLGNAMLAGIHWSRVYTDLQSQSILYLDELSFSCGHLVGFVVAYFWIMHVGTAH